MLIIFIVPLWSHSRTMIALVSSQAVRDTSANVQAKKIIDQVIRRKCEGYKGWGTSQKDFETGKTNRNRWHKK